MKSHRMRGRGANDAIPLPALLFLGPFRGGGGPYGNRQRMLLHTRGRKVPLSREGLIMATWHTYRSDGFGGTTSRKISPLQAIRQQCRACYGFASSVVSDIDGCPSEMCPLYPFRLGRDPGRRVTEKQREARRRNGLQQAPRLRNRKNMTTSRVGEGVG